MVHLQSNDYPVVQSLFSSASASFCKRWHSAGLTHQELRRFAEVGLLASDFRQPHPTISGLTVNPDSLPASSCTLKHPAYPAETFCSLRLDSSVRQLRFARYGVYTEKNLFVYVDSILRARFLSLSVKFNYPTVRFLCYRTS